MSCRKISRETRAQKNINPITKPYKQLNNYIHGNINYKNKIKKTECSTTADEVGEKNKIGRSTSQLLLQ